MVAIFILGGILGVTGIVCGMVLALNWFDFRQKNLDRKSAELKFIREQQERADSRAHDLEKMKLTAALSADAIPGKVKYDEDYATPSRRSLGRG